MARRGGRIFFFVLFAAGVILLPLWLSGRFTRKVPSTTPSQLSENVEGRIVDVRLIDLPQVETAIGTIRAVYETNIASRILARVVEVNFTAGKAVKAGDVLIRMDDADMQARLQQANAAMASAEAALANAAREEARMAGMLENDSASRQEYDDANTALKTSTAELTRAREMVNEIQVMLGWTKIAAPIEGIVVDKKIDVGDMAIPGQVLLTLYDPTRMQLIASVRESLAHRLQVGYEVEVRIDALDQPCRGKVSEIVPEIQTASRSFQVKVTGPCPAGVYSGMFGRIVIPLGREKVLVIPRQAVRAVGQLELVYVHEEGRSTQRAIRTGRALGDDVEVLSGLTTGEQVVIWTAREAGRG